MKWESDQQLGVIGWVPPRKKGATEQPRHVGTRENPDAARVDIDEALADRQVNDVLEVWGSARLHEAPAYSGGVLDAWPAVMVDGLAACRAEEQAIDEWRGWEEQSRG